MREKGSPVRLDEEQLAAYGCDGYVVVEELLPHYMAPNHSDNWRRAIALSYMSARSTYTGEGEAPPYFHIKGRSYAGCVR